MRVDEFDFETIVTAERGNYLKYVDETLTEDKVGRPIRIIFSKKANIPEFKEMPLDYVEEVVKEEKEKPKAKSTKKKSNK